MGVCIPSPTFIHLETKLNSAVPLSLVVYFRDGAVRWWPTEIRCDASRPRMSNNYTVTGVKNHFLVGNAVHSFFSCLSPLFRILVLLLFRLRRNYRAVMWNNSMTRAEDGYVGQYFPWLEEVNVRYILFWWIITSADRNLTYIRNFREITDYIHKTTATNTFNPVHISTYFIYGGFNTRRRNLLQRTCIEYQKDWKHKFQIICHEWSEYSFGPFTLFLYENKSTGFLYSFNS